MVDDGDALRQAASAVRRAQRAAEAGQHLTALMWSHRAGLALAVARRQLAPAARDTGASWAEIGAVLGMTRQGAQQALGGPGGRRTDRGDEDE